MTRRSRPRIEQLQVHAIKRILSLAGQASACFFRRITETRRGQNPDATEALYCPDLNLYSSFDKQMTLDLIGCGLRKFFLSDFESSNLFVSGKIFVTFPDFILVD